MGITDELLEHNAAYAAEYIPDRPLAPKRHLAVVACMDSRLDTFAMLGLDIGDAHVIRNAGGVVTDDVIRSLTISQRKLGTREIILIHHTNCGALTFTDDELRNELLDETGLKPTWSPECTSNTKPRTCVVSTRNGQRCRRAIDWRSCLLYTSPSPRD